MDNKTSDRNAKGNFLTRSFEVPAWLITVAVITLILSAVMENTLPVILLIIIVIVLTVIWLFRKQGPSTIKLKEVTLSGLQGYTINLTSVPDNITPELLQISVEEEKRLRGLEMDGVGLITSIAGNLVFRDKSGTEVNSFFPPIKLTYNFTSEDEEKLLQRQSLFPTEDVKLVPIYLYTYPEKAQEPKISIWKPFQNFSIDRDNKTMTIEFQFWGDQQTGYGTKP
ncbi:MAG TPA: hypothetical protein VLE49_14310 [Anaerolineales bacterium]|nr:hypothetical protein [Anaerolineales bacterium]